LYADIEESLGTFLTTKSVYEKIFDLKIATPLTILTYANYLKSQNHYEESFKVYEKGISIFKYPMALEIWVAYIYDFIDRYGGSKLERLRDLFEQALDTVPVEYAHILYLLYAESEEKYGMARHAMSIYDRATRSVIDEYKIKVYTIYIQRATENFGVTRTRKIFEKALQSLPLENIREMGLRYASLERRLGEIDRSRAIYQYVSQYCPPSKDTQFWEIWKKFEVQHGNKETVKEMFRIRRSVAATYDGSTLIDTAGDQMQNLEEDIELQEDGEKTEDMELEEPKDDVEIKIEDETEKEIEKVNEEDIIIIQQKEVPSSVYGTAIEHVEITTEKKRG